MLKVAPFNLSVTRALWYVPLHSCSHLRLRERTHHVCFCALSFTPSVSLSFFPCTLTYVQILGAPTACRSAHHVASARSAVPQRLSAPRPRLPGPSGARVPPQVAGPAEPQRHLRGLSPCAEELGRASPPAPTRRATGWRVLGTYKYMCDMCTNMGSHV